MAWTSERVCASSGSAASRMRFWADHLFSQNLIGSTSLAGTFGGFAGSVYVQCLAHTVPAEEVLGER